MGVCEKNARASVSRGEQMQVLLPDYASGTSFLTFFINEVPGSGRNECEICWFILVMLEKGEKLCFF